MTIEEIKEGLHGDTLKMVSATLINNLAMAQYANEQLLAANSTLTKEKEAARSVIEGLEKDLAALKKAAEPKPEILTPAAVPASP